VVLLWGDLSDILLVGHSYGGMVATGVADRARDQVSQLIYLDAFVPRDGQSLFDLASSRFAEAHVGSNESRRRMASST
jgi:pimeloyl-ACP methyl ester carboxylesterase